MANPYHDERGRFDDAPGGGAADNRAVQKAIERHNRRLYGEHTDRTEREWRALHSYGVNRGNEVVAAYHTPDRIERRTLATLPGAKFDSEGNLSNTAEMRSIYAARKR